MHAIQHHARGVLSAAAIATAALVGGTFATPASAQWASDNYAPYAAPATGVVVGTLAGKIFGAALQTTPAWVGPTILIGSIALVLVGVLLLPASVREFRAVNRGPAA